MKIISSIITLLLASSAQAWPQLFAYSENAGSDEEGSSTEALGSSWQHHHHTSYVCNGYDRAGSGAYIRKGCENGAGFSWDEGNVFGPGWYCNDDVDVSGYVNGILTRLAFAVVVIRASRTTSIVGKYLSAYSSVCLSCLCLLLRHFILTFLAVYFNDNSEWHCNSMEDESGLMDADEQEKMLRGAKQTGV